MRKPHLLRSFEIYGRHSHSFGALAFGYGPPESRLMYWPSPRLAPVTKATFSVRSNSALTGTVPPSSDSARDDRGG
jgi:hypothetical protein